MIEQKVLAEEIKAIKIEEKEVKEEKGEKLFR